MDYEGLAEVVVPLALFGIIGGLIALRMLKPYGDKILNLIREIQQDRHEALSEGRDLQSIRSRLDMVAERQDFLEALVKHRLDEDEQRQLEEMRRRALSSDRADRGAEESPAGGGEGSGATGEDGPGAGRAAGPSTGAADAPDGSSGSTVGSAS